MKIHFPRQSLPLPLTASLGDITFHMLWKMTDEFNECNSILRQMQPYKWGKSSLISEMIDQPGNSPYSFTLCQQAVFFTGGLLGSASCR